MYVRCTRLVDLIVVLPTLARLLLGGHGVASESGESQHTAAARMILLVVDQVVCAVGDVLDGEACRLCRVVQCDQMMTRFGEEGSLCRVGGQG